MKNITIFYLKNFQFLVMKFSMYLNRRVFVMVFNQSILTDVPGQTVSTLLAIHPAVTETHE